MIIAHISQDMDHKSYLIGCIHGIAGSGSLVALAASTMNSFEMMIYFLILFGDRQHYWYDYSQWYFGFALHFII